MININLEPKIEGLLAQKYPLTTEDTVKVVSECDQLGEILVEKTVPNQNFFTRILQHIRNFNNAEFMFLSGRYDKAQTSYLKLKSSISETQSEFPDLYSRWLNHINRLISRLDARVQETRAASAFNENDIVQADVLYVETVNRYSQELKVEQENSDYDHYFDTLGNIFRTTGKLLYLRGVNTKNKKELYQAIRNFKKAIFLGQPYLGDLIGEISNFITQLTISHIEDQAETLFVLGVHNSESERFVEAKNNYHKSAQYYRSLRRIHSNFEFELQEQIQLSSYYEAAGKNLMIHDNNEQAALQFSNAAQILQQVVQKLPVEELKENFEPQIIYFEAMQLYCQAVKEYDDMIPEAMDHFTEAKKKLEIARERATELQNTPLINNCSDALNKINSYQDIAKMMFELED
ncbi:hypothetical protein [Candidatus Hodarchaeum mangrovi]